jgi:hypothetical protein
MSRSQLIVMNSSAELAKRETQLNQSINDNYASFAALFRHKEIESQKEVTHKLLSYRNKDDILKAWPKVLEKMRIHQDSQVGKNMLEILLEELKYY